jgi:uncharacterized repeat protein (TIGR03837 family)
MVLQEQALAVECDVFCRVVDNFGDAAVAWRLARILAHEQGFVVRLLIDRPQVLARLLQRDAGEPLPWLVDQVSIDAFDRSRATSAPLLIETFGCGLPPGFMAARPAAAPVAVLINVEYLSAEEWPDGVHGLSSPAREDLPARHFFFPGFSAQTGGLLREKDVRARRIQVQQDAHAAGAFWQRLGFWPDRPDAPGTRLVSMFCYDHGFDEAFLQSLVGLGRVPLHLILAEGVMSRQVLAFCGANGVGSARQVGDLRVTVVPFLAQPEYDLLLAACDGNIVRGEDSFVRAQLAGRPMLWDIYPQDDAAHIAKQQAFARRYCTGWPRQAADQYQLLSSALVDRSDLLPAKFRRWCDELEDFQALAGAWALHLEGLPELGAQLAIFAEKLLK